MVVLFPLCISFDSRFIFSRFTNQKCFASLFLLFLSPCIRLFANQLVFYAEGGFCALIRLFLGGCPNGVQTYELFSGYLYLK